MVTLRRTDHEHRIEIMPLIDVIFLLLTFFIYAMVMMIRAELLPIEMQAFASGRDAVPAPAITLSLDRTGALFLDRQPIPIENALERLREALEVQPDAVVYLAAAEEGDRDRLPAFLALYDQLAYAGLDIRLVGRPDD
ncbi:MAG: biopolymer transporter ExbD [Phycisphaerales bacterium]|nr:biopolymer transporter ExbD [Phycisphaerae bacterium]NNF41731.1 biopolymer transporter ExbD [Phycisphaerales bacterium]NNM25671.1 biopolymer transporter ExbD [Phycisphaerales bacterium]